MKRAAFALGLATSLACAGSAGSSTTTVWDNTTIVSTSTTAYTTTTSTTTLPATTTTAQPMKVIGKVIDPEGEPVPGARVELMGVRSRTGEDGVFELESPDPGTLSVTRPAWTTGEFEWTPETRFALVEIEPRVIRGLRVSAGAAADDDVFLELLEIAENTAVNALVLDTKQEGGKVLYDTAVEEAHVIGAVEAVYDPYERVRQAKRAGLYTIARIAVFEDSFRARARPQEKLAGPWLDPRSKPARAYNIALAAEACEIGFDEVQFDYVRFPAGRTSLVSGQAALTEAERVGALEVFLRAARKTLRAAGCAVSADIFGIVVSATNDQGLGQRPEEFSRHMDVISPMVYPSHYAPGWLGFPDPNQFPYEVTADAIDDALPRMARGTALRPWLQAFWWSAAQIRRSIDAAEDRGVGWILWNVASNFDATSIPTDDEVASP